MTTRFQVRIRCTACGHRYKRVLAAEDEEALAEMPDPPCPACKEASKRAAFDFNGPAPAIGGNIAVRAMDDTMNMVAQDYGMTDLRTDGREGETMAPKLPPAQQAMADSFFSRPRNRNLPAIMQMSPRAVMASAVAGRFMTPDTAQPIAAHHKRRDPVRARLITGDGVPRGGMVTTLKE